MKRHSPTLQQLAGDKLDQDCVDALLTHQEQVEEIQRRFKESTR